MTELRPARSTKPDSSPDDHAVTPNAKQTVSLRQQRTSSRGIRMPLLAGRDAREHSSGQGHSTKEGPARVSPLARPTGTLLGLLLVGAVCCYLGLLFDERTLMTAAVTAAALCITDLLAFIGQWTAVRGTRAQRLFTPSYTERTVLYERVDQRGGRVSWHEGTIPQRRGLYVLRGVRVRWRSPLGLFAARRIIPGTGEERWMLPGPAASATPRERGLSETMPGFSEERTGGVRDYTPGDPLRGISWKHTAARGRLMSWETSREREPTLLLALNTCGSCGLNEARMDAEVSAILPYLNRNSGKSDQGFRRRVIVTDGHETHEDRDALRFLAAVCPVPDDSPRVSTGTRAHVGDSCAAAGDSCAVSDGSSRVSTGVRGKAEDSCAAAADSCAVSDGSCAESPNKCAVSAITCAQALSRTASALPKPVTVIIADASVSKGLRQALLHTPLAGKARILDPTAQETPQTAHLSSQTAQKTPPQGSPTPKPGSHIPLEPHNPTSRTPTKRMPRRGRPRSGTTRQQSASSGRYPTGLPRLIRALALTACLAVTMRALAGLVAPTGVWHPFAMALLALAVLEVSLPASRGTAAREGKDVSPPLNGRGASSSLDGERSVREGKTSGRGMGVLRRVGGSAVRRWWRRLRYPVLVVVATVAVLFLRFRSLYGAWPTSPRVCRVGGVSGRCFTALLDEAFARPLGDAVSASGPGRRSLIATLREGFDALYLQLPPLKVEGAADLFLIILSAFVALAVRAMIGVRAPSAFAVLLPVSALAANALLLGETAPWPTVGVVTCSWPLLLWSASASRSVGVSRLSRASRSVNLTHASRQPASFHPAIRVPDFPLAALSALLVTALTMACAPAAERWAYRTPLSLDVSGMSEMLGLPDMSGVGGSASVSGLFSSNTVEPLVDLRRSLSGRSSKTAFTYRADRALYLRLTSLDRFDGDVWGYDRDFALDAGLYGSGVRLGFDRSNTLRDRERRYTSPLREAASWDSSGVWPESLSEVLEGLDAEAEVTVVSLRSRLLPVLSDTGVMSGVGEGWLRYRDGSVYNRASLTEEGLSYTASGVAFDPVRGVSGFAQVDAAHGALADALASASSTSDMDADDADAGARREAAVDELRRTVDSSDRQAHDDRYLWLPDGLPEHVRAVLDEARADGVALDGADYASQSRVMRWLVSWFTDASNGFTYDLSAPDGDGRSNLQVVDDFLASDGRRGYCQHYASALAVLGRAMGVPTRVALGYASGVAREASSDDDGARLHVVSEGNLHAWTEAYLDGVGWVPFDVTPASGVASSSASDGGGDPASAEDGANGDASGDGDAVTTDHASDGDASDGDAVTTDHASDGDASDGDADAAGSESDDSPSDGAVDSPHDGHGARAGLWPRFLAAPPWMRVALAVCALAVAAASVACIRRLRRSRSSVRGRGGANVRWRPPRWLHRRARRRVLAMARRAQDTPEDAGLSARAWREAWRLVRREGWHAGVRWEVSATDAMIAEALWRAMDDGSADHATDRGVPTASSTSAMPAGIPQADAPVAGDTPIDGFDVPSDGFSGGVRTSDGTGETDGTAPTLRDDLFRLARNADAGGFFRSSGACGGAGGGAGACVPREPVLTLENPYYRWNINVFGSPCAGATRRWGR